MSGGDQRLAVQRLRPRQKVEEKINAEHVHDVGVADMIQHTRRDRISSRPGIRYPGDLDAVDRFVGRQKVVVRAEQAVEGDHAHPHPCLRLLARQCVERALQSADAGLELAAHMHDA